MSLDPSQTAQSSQTQVRAADNGKRQCDKKAIVSLCVPHCVVSGRDVQVPTIKYWVRYPGVWAGHASLITRLLSTPQRRVSLYSVFPPGGPHRGQHRGHTGPTQGPHRGNTGPTQGQHRGHTGPTQGQHRGHTGAHTGATRGPHGGHTGPTQGATQGPHRAHTGPTPGATPASWD